MHAPLPVLPDRLETERLVLRTPVPGDGAVVNAAIRESFETLRVWMKWADQIPEVEETEELCRHGHEAFLAREHLPLLLFRREDTAFVGRCDLHFVDLEVPKFEIGYWLRTRYERQGYMTEAVRALTRCAFETLHARRVEIRCDPRNIGSRRVAEKAGYRLEARLRDEQVAPDGNLRDTLIYVLLAGEYFPVSPAGGRPGNPA
jgi:RimJ/RimL family protein N-acetyltransferase